MKRNILKLILFLMLFFGIFYILLFVGFMYLKKPIMQAFSNLNSTQQQTPQTTLPIVYEESTITSAVKKAIPSVVTVGIETQISSAPSIQFNPFNPFRPFQQTPGKTTQVKQNIGSGFIVSADGYVVTNKHVVDDTTAKYQVLTNDNKKYEVKDIYRDPLNDVAILKVEATDLQPIQFGDSVNLELGQIAIAIGTQLGEFNNTVTVGVVSGLGRGITAGSPYEGNVENLSNVIQTDAAINPGNSGGPLLNSKGEAIGINTAVSAEGQNIGFAIPVSVVQQVLDSFKARGFNFSRPFIGISYKMITKELAILNDIPEGAYVIDVATGSGADKAGIKKADIITKLDGIKIDTADDAYFTKKILDKNVGDTVVLTVWADNQSRDVTVVLGKSAQ